jgi:hypothetical protein
MKQGTFFLAALVTGALMHGTALAQDNLIYVATGPCRVADTRLSTEGVIKANTHRDFRVTGTTGELAAQGGEVSCPNPRPGEPPVAVAAYVLAVTNDSSTGKGVLSAYPSGQSAPPVGSGSTVNFGDGQTIGNTTITSLCTASCPTSGELAVLTRNSDRDVVIDVQGYFYPSGYDVVRATIEPGVVDSVNDYELFCPAGKRPYGGGFRAVDDSEAISVRASTPNNAQTGWVWTYQVIAETDVVFSVTCASG